MLSQALGQYGRKLVVTSLDRSCEDQLPLFCDGRGSWPRSYHLAQGLAFDAVVFPYTAADQRTVGQWGKQIGLAWGGEFEQRDEVHFDLRRYGYGPGDCSKFTRGGCSTRKCLCPEKGSTRGSSFTQGPASYFGSVDPGSLLSVPSGSETAGRPRKSRIPTDAGLEYYHTGGGIWAVDTRTRKVTRIV